MQHCFCRTCINRTTVAAPSVGRTAIRSCGEHKKRLFFLTQQICKTRYTVTTPQVQGDQIGRKFILGTFLNLRICPNLGQLFFRGKSYFHLYWFGQRMVLATFLIIFYKHIWTLCSSGKSNQWNCTWCNFWSRLFVKWGIQRLVINRTPM
jgi:hypothetical protein